MKVKTISLGKAAAKDIELKDDIFKLPVRADILQRVVEWQRARKQAGTHFTKSRGDIVGGAKKPFRQKGTGNARQGSKRAPHMRGGAVAHGPKNRSHAYDLPKKVRKLGLKTALSAKAADGKLQILDSAKLKAPKTGELAQNLNKLGIASALIIDNEVDENFRKAANNIKNIDILPHVGANVYDILRHDNLILTVDAVKHLEERLA